MWVCVSSFHLVKCWGRPSQTCWDVQSHAAGLGPQISEHTAQGNNAERPGERKSGSPIIFLLPLLTTNLAWTNWSPSKLIWQTINSVLRQWRLESFKFGQLFSLFCLLNETSLTSIYFYPELSFFIVLVLLQLTVVIVLSSFSRLCHNFLYKTH